MENNFDILEAQWEPYAKIYALKEKWGQHSSIKEIKLSPGLRELQQRVMGKRIKKWLSNPASWCVISEEG